MDPAAAEADADAGVLSALSSVSASTSINASATAATLSSSTTIPSSSTSPAGSTSYNASTPPIITLSDVPTHRNNGDNFPLFSFLNVPSSIGALDAIQPASSSASLPAAISSSSGYNHTTAASAVVPGLALNKRQSRSFETEEDPEVMLKRQRNSMAARKYRQKKVDRISELESEVGQLQQERDALRIQLARQEAETAALREMLLGNVGRKDGDVGGEKRNCTRRTGDDVA
ncbi:bzip transcription factor idi-4 [Grosmannia clavigera kw1407]|uniref:Bzip transcription factor idi-4 n=1 Tax=Grosmannia clavigera (strain kw1407 / UAMH 11150) TaxID=655863 RepID=F0XDM2_GROCL|nr:bzip transcription factor idi-4 [Grosmannia clavigera kw1407]EFX03884.1 bzip transcription factor idi-4 [Grosmannia clavigera kw1407]